MATSPTARPCERPCRALASRHPLRRREPRRSQHPGLRPVRPHQRPRHAGACSTPPAQLKVRAIRASFSTDEVYGSLGETGFFTEETPLAPNSPYAASKAARTCSCAAIVHTFGLPAVITRCSNNYGPYQFPEKLIPLFITNLLRDEPVPVYGDGQNVRDWIHVRDHCAGIHRRLASRPSRRGLQLRRPLRDDQPGADARPARRCWASRPR